MYDNDTPSFSTAKDCGPLTVPLNGSITGRETTFPNEVRLSCNEGFILYGSTVRSCQADATWSGNETSCKGKIENTPGAFNKSLVSIRSYMDITCLSFFCFFLQL